MLTRNLKYTRSGDVDMEIDHPKYSWIPFTASPNDTELHGRELYAQAIAGTLGAIAAADPKTQAELDAEALAATDASALVTAKLDATIKYLVTHTPAEIENYVTTNVTNLASAVNLLSKLAVAVSILAKRELR